MEKFNEKFKKAVVSTLAILIPILTFPLYFVINALPKIDGGLQLIAVILIIVAIIGAYVFLISLLRKKSIELESTSYGNTKWYQKSKFWGVILFSIVFIISAFNAKLSADGNIIPFLLYLLLAGISISMIWIPRIASFSIILFWVLDLVILISRGTNDWIVLLVTVLIKIAYILLCIRILLVEKNKKQLNPTPSSTDKIVPLKTSKPKKVNKISIAMVAVVIVLTLGLIGGAFYWFAYRPTEIRKNCAKVSVTISAVQEVTKEEADLSKANNEECKSKIDVDGAINQWYEEEKCNQQYPIKEQTQYQPERQSVRDAKDSEYQKCLRENGLQ